MEWKNFEFLNGMINGIAMLTACRCPTTTQINLIFLFRMGKMVWFDLLRAWRHQSKQAEWNEGRIVWFGLVGLGLLIGWVNGWASSQWLRPRRQTKHQTNKALKSEWIDCGLTWAEFNNLWNEMEKLLNEADQSHQSMNGAPSASAVSEINQFFFCWPAVRHQKEELNDWRVLAGGRGIKKDIL